MSENIYILIVVAIGIITWFCNSKVVFCITPFVFNLDSLTAFSGKSISFLFFAVSFFGLMLRYFMMRPENKSRYIFILFLFCLYILFGSMFRENIIPSLIKAISLSVFCYLFVTLIRSYHDLQHILISFVVSGFVTALLYIIWGPGISNLISADIYRGHFLDWDINTIAVQWGSSYIISLFYITSKKGFQRNMFIAIAVVCGIASIATLSRGIFTSILVTSVFIFILSVKWKLRLVILMSIISLAIWFPTNLMVRLKDINVGDTPRVKLWEKAVIIIRDNPYFGVGEGDRFLSAVTSIQTGSPSFYAHNSYLQSAANWGIPAGIMFTIMTLGTLLGLYIYYRKSTKIIHKIDPLFFSIFSCLVIYLVAILFLSREGSKDLYFVLGLCWTFLALEKKQDQLIL